MIPRWHTLVSVIYGFQTLCHCSFLTSCWIFLILSLLWVTSNSQMSTGQPCEHIALLEPGFLIRRLCYRTSAFFTSAHPLLFWTITYLKFSSPGVQVRNLVPKIQYNFFTLLNTHNSVFWWTGRIKLMVIKRVGNLHTKQHDSLHKSRRSICSGWPGPPNP